MTVSYGRSPRVPKLQVLLYSIPLIAALIFGAAHVCEADGLPANRAADAAALRSVESFDNGWRFLKADAPGAENPAFDDASWKMVSVPHDWGIEGPFDQANPAGGAGAFLPTGVSLYRRHFAIPAADAGRRVFIEFDGVMANSDVWINGFHLGKRPNGYVGFRYDLTGHVRSGNGAENVLAVRADTSAQPASRWYAGSGIYRHVRLIMTDAVHIDTNGTFVSTPAVSEQEAMVKVETSVVNQSPTARTLRTRLKVRDPSGKVAASGLTDPKTVPPGQTAVFASTLKVLRPALWDLEHPVLYSASAEVLDGSAIRDAETTRFGIRDARFEAASGFWLNGKNIKLKGVCLHQDAGAFGVAVPSSVWAKRLTALRAIGVNAIRTAHNPPSPEFLSLCDTMGFFVMDEMFDCWTVAKNKYDYHLYFNDWSTIDTRDTVRRDRNHPSIVLYSAGNEIHDTPNAELSKKILASLVSVFHAEDPTRPVTQALFRPNVSHDYDDGLADLLDVVGTNYRDAELLAAHEAKPTRKIVGTENGPDLKAWRAVRDNAPYSGQFLWVGIDYLGESRRWPTIGGGGDQAGLLDRTGAPKPIAFQRQSWWAATPMVRIARRVAPDTPRPTDPGYGNTPIRRTTSLLCDWTPRSLTAHDESVEVYSNAQSVELFLNGKSLGSKPVDPDGAPTTWKVPFESGALKAVASKDRKAVAEDEVRTAGKAARVVLTTDYASLSTEWDEVAAVTATVVDADGVPVPGGDQEIRFKVTGGGEIAAVDNADNASHESFRGDSRHAYHGRCVAFVRMTKAVMPLTVTASAAGLTDGTITIQNAAGLRTPGKVIPGSKTK